MAGVEIREMVFEFTFAYRSAKKSARRGTSVRRSLSGGANIGKTFISHQEMPMDERIREAFRSGDLILNLNTPHEWNGVVETVPLGARWYHGATKPTEHNDGFILGAASIEDEPLPKTDCSGLMAGNVVISPLATWPQTHPLNVPDSILHAALSEDADGYPSWLCESESKQ